MLIPIKFIFYVGLLIFAFFSGVKYSEQARGTANWLFEAKEQEIDFKEIEKDLRDNKDISAEQEVVAEPIEEEAIENDIIVEGEIISEGDIIEDNTTPNEPLNNE